MKAFIASLVQTIPNKHASLSSMSEFSLVRVMAMDIGCASEHSKGNIRYEMGEGIGFFETI